MLVGNFFNVIRNYIMDILFIICKHSPLYIGFLTLFPTTRI